MAEVIDEIDEQATPQDLRSKLEAALKENRKLQSDVNQFRAKETLAAKGFDLVKPEDLNGVKPDEIEARAEQIQNERKQLQQDLLRDALKKQGYDGEALDEMLSGFAADKSAETTEAEQVAQARALGHAAGKPAPLVDTSKLHGLDAIRAGLK